MPVSGKKKGILLDVGVRFSKLPNWTGIDSSSRPDVDIVHDLEKIPYPLVGESCLTIKAAHVAEHIPPKMFFRWMDEMWRLLKVDGQLVLSAPYAGSVGYWADPTHVTHLTEATFQLFDPDFIMYRQYRPKPWSIEHASWKPTGDIEAILRKRPEQDENMVLAVQSLERGALQKASELSKLYAMLRGKSLGVIVEIGTSNAGVFYGLCQLAKSSATIVSIDLPGGPFGGVYVTDGNKHYKTYGRPGQRLEFLRFDSHKPDTLRKLKRILGNVPIDFLFIDGDHTYDGVKKDYEMYSPLVRKGGMIAFHDICHHAMEPRCQVDKFWKEIKAGKKTTEIIDAAEKSWGGIGVIFT